MAFEPSGLAPCEKSYTICGFWQARLVHGSCTTVIRDRDSLSGMATEEEWKERIGARIKQLRELKGWSLGKLAIETGDRLKKSAISNYEQGTRMPGPEEAILLAEAMGESPAHILCLDDDMPALSKLEAELIRNMRILPENERAQYAERIAALAMAYKKPVPDKRVSATAYNSKKRPKPAVTTKRTPGSNDN